MADHSTISWTDATWPIVAGCEYASPGCSNCWAVRDSWRLAHNPNPKVHNAYFGTVDKLPSGKLVWSGIIRPLPERLDWPLKWRGFKRIFVCSQADLFHPKVPNEFIAAAFGVMAVCPQHTFQVLTKHPGRMRSFFEWVAGQQNGAAETCAWEARHVPGVSGWQHDEPVEWPLPNVWIGVTVEDQRRAEERIPELLRTPAAKRWLSVEPMLEAINLRQSWVDYLEGWTAEQVCCGRRRGGECCGDPDAQQVQTERIDWVVCGGESAQTRANTRPFAIEWARDLMQQCRAASVPFFMKQLGTAPTWRGHSGPGEHWPADTTKNDTGHGYFAIMPPVGKGSRYKFHDPEHWPEDLRVQEFPA